MQPEHAGLLKQLRVAFPPEPIRAAGAFSEWGVTYLDIEPYSQHIDGKTWEQLDRAYVITRSDAIGFLGTQHLIAVLPVYLRSLLEEGVWSVALYSVLSILTKPGPEKKTGIKLPRFQALVEALTPAQRTVIAAILRAFAATDEGGTPGTEACLAIESYWKPYLPDGP